MGEGHYRSHWDDPRFRSGFPNPTPNTIPEIEQAIWAEKELHPYSEDCQKIFDILDLATKGELPRIKG